MTKWTVTGTATLRVSKREELKPGATFTAADYDPPIAPELLESWRRIGAITEVGRPPIGTVVSLPELNNGNTLKEETPSPSPVLVEEATEEPKTDTVAERLSRIRRTR